MDREYHSWHSDLPDLSHTTCHACQQTLPQTREHIQYCGACRAVGTHKACHLQEPNTVGDWICPQCLQSPEKEQLIWQGLMQTYNDQNSEDSEQCLTKQQQPFPGDTEGGKQFTDWQAFRAYALDPQAPSENYLLTTLYASQDKPINIKPKLIFATQRRKKADNTSAATYTTVEWQDTYLLQHHLENYLAAGYKAKQVSDPIHHNTSGMPHFLQLCVSQNNPVVRIQWEPSEEQHPHMEETYGLYWDKLWAKTQEQVRQHSRFEDLTPLQQQGIWDSPTPPPLPLSQKWHKQLKIQTTPVHPEMDIPATGEITLQQHPNHPHLTCAYDPSGRYLGHMHQDTLTSLRNNSNLPSPLAFAKAIYTAIQTDLAAFKKKTAHSTHHRLPDWLANALQATSLPWTEAYSTALTHHPALSSYLTPHSADLELGAKGIWNQQIWQGYYVITTPKDHALTNKLLRWALSSSLHQQQHPFLALILLPDNDTRGKPWTSHPHFQDLAKITRPLCHTSKSCDTATDMQKFLFGYKAGKIGVICNEPGWSTLKRIYPTLQFHSHKEAAKLHRPPDWYPLDDKWEPDPNFLADIRFNHLQPSKFRKLTVTPPPTTSPTQPTTSPSPLATWCPAPPSPRYWTPLQQSEMIYTDGSCIKTAEGNQCSAGVYIPSSKTAVKVDPAGIGVTNTINRAELAGILVAILEGLTTHKHIFILTDSMCSLLQINKFLLYPQTYLLHIHQKMLQAITAAIDHRCQMGGSITLLKVKAHIGIPGNEAADKIASTPYPPLGTTMTHTTLTVPAKPFEQLIWPHCHRTTTATTLEPLTSLKHLPATLPRLTKRLIGIYEQAWYDVMPYLLPLCKAYILQPHIPSYVQHVIFRLWHGCLYNQKHACRFGHSTNPNCPLCGHLDSAGHMLGSCTHPDITGLRINRHNDAVRQVGKLIRLSKQVDIHNSIIYMDAGNAADHIIQSESTRLPKFLLPHLTDEERAKYRPDLLCITVPPGIDRDYVKQGIMEENCHIYILEISFCGDTRYLDHAAHKAQQHLDLVEELVKTGWIRSHIHLLDPTLFGMGGCLYTPCVDNIVNNLHVPRHIVIKYFQEIQLIAANRATQIVGTRRFLERQQGIHVQPRKSRRTRT